MAEYPNLPFGFTPEEELPGGLCSRVYATQDLVLKIPFQGEELDSGFRAALAMSGTIGPKVLKGDPATGAILMERIRPGTKLMDGQLSEEERLEIFAEKIQLLQKLPVEGMLPTKNFYSQSHPLLDNLLSSGQADCFLHGDLHHENILLSGADQWIVIDPKGLRGEPEFEAAAWIRNPAQNLKTEQEIQRQTEVRLTQMESVLGWDPWRMIAWTWLSFVLDNDEPDPTHPWTIFEKAIRPMVGKDWIIG
jgi:streptomycin 6-kinase